MKRTHVYISVMGTMGSGKTTAARLLAKHFGFTLIEENFGENAFLPRFYQDMKRWAFHSQTFFLMEKITQMLSTKTLLEKSSVIQDTPIQQDVFSYAKAQYVLGNIDDAEWKLYQKIFGSFEPYFPVPNLIIFLDTQVGTVISRIEKRGRSYEKGISESYLELLDMLARRWITENKTIPLKVVNTDDLNLVHNRRDQQQFVDFIRHEIT